MSGYTDEMQKEYPPTIIAFSDAMRLLQMARDAYETQCAQCAR